MANLRTTLDILKAALGHAGELQNEESPYWAKGLEYVNRTYQEVINGGSTFIPEMCEAWEWARARNPGRIVLVPPYTDGTVTLTNLSAAGTFSVAPSATLGSFEGRIIKLTNSPEVYRIATHIAGSASFTLLNTYIGTTGAYTYRANQIDYTLTGYKVSKLVQPMKVYKAQGWSENANWNLIYGISARELADLYTGSGDWTGTPTKFAVIYERDNVPTVRFSHSVQELTQVEFEYVEIADDLTVAPDMTPILPREDRLVLAYGAAYFIMIDKEDSRADAYFRFTQAKLQSMIMNRRAQFGQTSGNYGRFLPRQGQVNMTVPTSYSGLRLY